jgi:hypothetical protein
MAWSRTDLAARRRLQLAGENTWRKCTHSDRELVMSDIDIETRYAGGAEEVKVDPLRVVIVGGNPFGVRTKWRTKKRALARIDTRTFHRDISAGNC